MKKILMLTGSLMEPVGNELRRRDNNYHVHVLSYPGKNLREKNTWKFRRLLKNNDWDLVIVQPNRNEVTERWWDGEYNLFANDALRIARAIGRRPMMWCQPWLPYGKTGAVDELQVDIDNNCYHISRLNNSSSIILTYSISLEGMDDSGHLNSDGVATVSDYLRLHLDIYFDEELLDTQ